MNVSAEMTIRPIMDQVKNRIAAPWAGHSSLRYPQKLRACFVGAVFEACRPHLAEEDGEDMGYLMALFADWAIRGSRAEEPTTFQVRLDAASEVYQTCKPSFTKGDKDDLDHLLGDIGEWVLDPGILQGASPEEALTQCLALCIRI